MRISTAQMFHQNISSINQSQQSSSQIIAQLSSGKRVETAGDDPVAAVGIDNLTQRNAVVSQFLKNIDAAQHRLGIAESQIGNAEILTDQIRESMLSAMNGTLSQEDRQTIADDMNQSLQALLGIANTQDESGNFLFSGFKTDTQPFAFDNTGTAIYSGDSGVRQAVVASGVSMNTSIAGDALFMNAANGMGDYSVNYLAAQQGDFVVESAKILDPALHTAGTYTFDFIDNGAGGVDLDVTDPLGVVTNFPSFDASNPIVIDDMEVKLDGEPVAGDSFSIDPVATVSLLDTIEAAITLVSDSDKLNSPQGYAEMAQLLNNIDSGQKQLALGRSEAGNGLKALENFSSHQADEQIVNQSALSMLEDLDYASAITEFEKQQLALNAASSVFGKVSTVSLFNYI